MEDEKAREGKGGREREKTLIGKISDYKKNQNYYLGFKSHSNHFSCQCCLQSETRKARGWWGHEDFNSTL